MNGGVIFPFLFIFLTLLAFKMILTKPFFIILSLFSLLITYGCYNGSADSNRFEKTVINKVAKAAVHFQSAKKNPRSIDKNGNIEMVSSRDWTSGFYPGCLWYAYELSNDTALKNSAIAHTVILESEKNNCTTHDMGFKLYCSYGNGYRLTHDEKFKDVLLEGAKTLTSRFNPVTGCIRSWDHHKSEWDFPVIIDNMMNLELLFWAFNQTHDSVYYKIAVSHANQTLKNHFRSDYSSYHVVDYDTTTGAVITRTTHQGYSDESAWARGQAWGLYGFTMAYRFTKDPKYLQQAEHIADFILNNKNLPADLVPYWDFNAPGIPDEPRDVSAAAIICSALFELNQYSPDKSTYYYKTAKQLLNNLYTSYLTSDDPPECYFILKHSTGNIPSHSEIDVPIIYADYYFLEAIVRDRNIASLID